MKFVEFLSIKIYTCIHKYSYKRMKQLVFRRHKKEELKRKILYIEIFRIIER